MRNLFLGSILLAGMGCTQLQPVGPMAKVMKPHPGQPLPAAVENAAPAVESPVAAARPTPPAVLITPDEVTPDSSVVAAQKLMEELKYDRKNAPVTAEVSRVRNSDER